MLIACPEQTIVEFKKFNTTVVTPHEALMALKPELFPWECRITTHFSELLGRQESQDKSEDVSDILGHEYQASDETALANFDAKHRELVPIFSS